MDSKIDFFHTHMFTLLILIATHTTNGIILAPTETTKQYFKIIGTIFDFKIIPAKKSKCITPTDDLSELINHKGESISILINRDTIVFSTLYAKPVLNIKKFFLENQIYITTGYINTKKEY